MHFWHTSQNCTSLEAVRSKIELALMLEFGTFVVALIAFIIAGGFTVETIQKRKRTYKI